MAIKHAFEMLLSESLVRSLYAGMRGALIPLIWWFVIDHRIVFILIFSERSDSM